MSPVLQDQERSVDHRRIVGGNLQLEHRLVEAGVGVDVGPEAHAGRLQECDHVLFREVAGAVETHVLDEVRQAPLVVVFENRSGVHHQPQLGPALRLVVGAKVVAQAVRQRPDGNTGIDGDGGGQGNVLRAGRDRALGGGYQSGGRDDQREHHQRRAVAKAHEKLQGAKVCLVRRAAGGGRPHGNKYHFIPGRPA